VLTLASIVESEAQIKDERARIARVYLNRLERHMRLQADPTVGYGLGLGPRSRLYIRQLRYESPFNTYLFEGLPPGPICNPGEAAVDAVLNPTAGVNDLYFVARGEGRHLFAETYPQHLRNIALARSMIAAERRGAVDSPEDSMATLAIAEAESVAAPPPPRPAPSPSPSPPGVKGGSHTVAKQRAPSSHATPTRTGHAASSGSAHSKHPAAADSSAKAHKKHPAADSGAKAHKKHGAAADTLSHHRLK
jgi:hypothetical protein